MLTKKLRLLLDEPAGGHIKHLIKILKENGSHALELLKNSHNIAELVTNANAEMSFNTFSTVTDDVTNAAYHPIRKSLLFRYGERSYVAEGAAKEILEEQLCWQ